MNAMMGLYGDLFGEINRLQQDLDQLFRPSASASVRAMPRRTFPVINVGNTPDAVEVLALAPGIDPSALQITVDRGVLVIAGERNTDMMQNGQGSGQGSGQGGQRAQGASSGQRKQGSQSAQGKQAERMQGAEDEGLSEDISVYAQERFSGSFRRVISLPDDVDAGQVNASYRDGMLRVRVPRREAAKPRRIQVS